MDTIDAQFETMVKLIFRRGTNTKTDFYELLYQSVTVTFRGILIQHKPLQAFDILLELMVYYTEKEQYERCAALNKLGMEIYN